MNAKGGITGLSALHQAAFHGHTGIARLLVAAGADVNATSRRGETPLHSTVYWGHREIAALLIANGADVKATDREGHTPLHAAAMAGWDSVELLIANGADVNAKVVSGSYKGMTPLDLASKAEIAELIRKLGGRKGE